MFLPDEYNAKYRPAFDIYKNILGTRLLDGYSVLKKNTDTFYKTDTHINFKGGYYIYIEWVAHTNNLFSLDIPINNINVESRAVPALSHLNLGIGDLTWPSNLGDQVIPDTSDSFYFSNAVRSIYMVHKITLDSDIRILDYSLLDVTSRHDGKTLEWNILSKNILQKTNTAGINKRVLFFYDSFLLSTLSMYMDIFKETYMIKSEFKPAIVDLVKPDLIFEFRVERFLF